MAYSNIGPDGAIAFDWITQLVSCESTTTAFTLSGQQFIVEKGTDITKGWNAIRFHKSGSPLFIPGVIDLHPYIITWAQNLDNHQTDGLQSILVGLNERSRNLAEWRQGLSKAESDAIFSGICATASGVSTVVSGAAFVGDLLAGGIPWASGLVMLCSGGACAASISNMEAAATRGNHYVKQINSTMFELVDLGRQLDLPFCTPHHTPVIQSACTDLAKAFGCAREQLRATQAGINNYLHSELRFSV